MNNGLIKKYFIIAGAAANIVFLSAVMAAYLFLDMPVNLALSKVVNSLAAKDESYFRNAGKVLGHFVYDENIRALEEQKSKWLLSSAASPSQKYSRQRYDDFGRPLIAKPGFFLPPSGWRRVIVSNEKELLKAIKSAKPGDVISLTAGRYKLSGQSIPVTQSGTSQKPVYVRSSRFGDVIIEMNTLEGFHVKAPFWVFENLDLQGVCSSDGECEHAFHVIGKGHSFVLRNSRLSNFNASIKVNGINLKRSGIFPDNGLLQGNIFVNTHVRDTKNPVTLININSVNNWVVRGNLIADFAKGKGDRVSYAAFMKGNGKNGIFEQNMVICEYLIPRDDGVRIGLSLGGGGTGSSYCRNKNCSVEHSNGIIRNNIIMNCSRDVGIYLNRSKKSLIYNNLLHNTLGIDVRFSSSSANIVNNLVAGRLKSRDGGVIIEKNNIIDKNCIGYRRRGCSFDSLFQSPDDGDFRLKSIENSIFGAGIMVQGLGEDFCGQIRQESEIDMGPIQYSKGLECLQP